MEKLNLREDKWRLMTLKLVGETPLICHKWNPNTIIDCVIRKI